MNPWDKTWTAYKQMGRYYGVHCTHDGRGYDLVIETTGGLAGFFDEDEANLAAAAPDLYRALEEAEWGGHCASYGAHCPCCDAYAKDHGRKHHDGCALEAALRKARGE